jgi:hypothetical protein
MKLTDIDFVRILKIADEYLGTTISVSVGNKYLAGYANCTPDRQIPFEIETTY